MALWLSPSDLKFSGEPSDLGEDSVSSSPVSSTETEDAGTSTCKSRPHVHVLPLDELGVVGACRRGRRKGQRNRTPAQRVMEAEGKRTEKNVRERMRVEHVRDEYLKLQMLLGFGHNKSVNKLQTLNAAIDYIKELRKLLDRLQGEAEGENCSLPPAPSVARDAQEMQGASGALQDSEDKRKANSFSLHVESNAAGAQSFLDLQLADLPEGGQYEDVYIDGDEHCLLTTDITGLSHHSLRHPSQRYPSLEHPSLTHPSSIAMLPRGGAVALTTDLPTALSTPLPEYTFIFDTNIFDPFAYQTSLHH